MLIKYVFASTIFLSIAVPVILPQSGGILKDDYPYEGPGGLHTQFKDIQKQTAEEFGKAATSIRTAYSGFFTNIAYQYLVHISTTIDEARTVLIHTLEFLRRILNKVLYLLGGLLTGTGGIISSQFNFLATILEKFAALVSKREQLRLEQARNQTNSTQV